MPTAQRLLSCSVETPADRVVSGLCVESTCAPRESSNTILTEDTIILACTRLRVKLTSTTHDNSTAHSLSYETFVSLVIET